jgi:hypothetical protein
MSRGNRPSDSGVREDSAWWVSARLHPAFRVLGLLVLLSAGCADSALKWHRVPIPAPDTLQATLQKHMTQIWTPRGSGAHVNWIAVAVSRDSVSGIPYKPFGGSGRVTVPLTDVDSIRVGYTTAYRYVLDGIGLVGLAGAFVLLECLATEPGHRFCH